jgi:G3E family GTPase
MSFLKINKVKIEPIKNIDDKRELPLKGSDLFNTKNCIINISSRKRSGKSTVIHKILTETAGRDTTIIIFSPTIDFDPVYKSLFKKLDNKKIKHYEYHNFIEDGFNHLEDLLNGLQEEHDEEHEEEDEPVTKQNKFLSLILNTPTETENKKVVRKKKLKYIAPDYILIFDDLGDSLRHPSIAKLCRVHRHYQIRIIFATHTLKNLQPSCLANIDYMLVFRGYAKESLTRMNELVDLGVSDEQLIDKYDKCTIYPYSFLYIDIRNGKFRCKFDKELIN